MMKYSIYIYIIVSETTVQSTAIFVFYLFGFIKNMDVFLKTIFLNVLVSLVNILCKDWKYVILLN